jgi:hypothetical protein
MPVDQTTRQAIQQFERMAAQMLIAEIAFAIIGTLIFFYLLYLVIRYAIRDGLRDAQRLDRRTTITRTRDEIKGPDIRAD